MLSVAPPATAGLGVYVGITIAAALEGEITFVGAAVLVSQGMLDPVAVIAAGALGAALGDQFYFYVFRGPLGGLRTGPLARWLGRKPVLAARGVQLNRDSSVATTPADGAGDPVCARTAHRLGGGMRLCRRAAFESQVLNGMAERRAAGPFYPSVLWLVRRPRAGDAGACRHPRLVGYADPSAANSGRGPPHPRRPEFLSP